MRMKVEAARRRAGERLRPASASEPQRSVSPRADRRDDPFLPRRHVEGDDLEQPVGGHWLVKVGDGAELLGVVGHVLPGGQEHDRNIARGAVGLERAYQLVTVHVRHADVGDDQVRGGLEHMPPRDDRVFRSHHVVARVRQVQLQQLEHALVVVYDQDSGPGLGATARHGSIKSRTLKARKTLKWPRRTSSRRPMKRIFYGWYMVAAGCGPQFLQDRKSTRLNSSHSQISYAVFCLTKKKNNAI